MYMEAMIQSCAQCEGAAAVTARRGLWEAESTVEWFDLSSSKYPLPVPYPLSGSVISQYGVDKFNEFAKILWTVIVGPEKISEKSSILELEEEQVQCMTCRSRLTSIFCLFGIVTANRYQWPTLKYQPKNKYLSAYNGI